MTIEAEALRALSEKATQGEWHHCQPFKSVSAVRTVHGRVPAQRVDYVSTWPALGTPPGHRVIIPMEGRECHVSSDDMAFIAALVSAYRFGDLIHRSVLAEETARAVEGTQLVPTEANEAMQRAGMELALRISLGGDYGWLDYMADLYRAMLAAAPALPLTLEAPNADR